jgi:hypothetical protein
MVFDFAVSAFISSNPFTGQRSLAQAWEAIARLRKQHWVCQY